MPDRTARRDPDRYGSVLWDDGELDLVEWERLLPLSEMHENPDGVPVISYDQEIGGCVRENSDTRTGYPRKSKPDRGQV